MTTATINGFDARTADDAAKVMAAVVVTYEAMARNTRSSLDAQTQLGIDGAPLAFVQRMHEEAMAVMQTAQVSRDEFLRQVELMRRTVGQGAGGSLRNTQKGGHMDPTRL